MVTGGILWPSQAHRGLLAYRPGDLKSFCMQPASIAGLLSLFLGPSILSTEQLGHISTYIDLLLRWNARINLTAIRDPEDIVTRHFGESLFAARHLFPIESGVGRAREGVGGGAASQGRVNSRETTGALAPERPNDQRPTTNDRPTIADIGAGAGFPGLPIKLWAPHISLTLIESNHKKAAFLKEVTRAL